MTKPRSPTTTTTTTGKVERFHQTLQQDCLNVHGPFDDVAAAQKAVDEFRYDYNHERPHQALDDDVPAARFTAVPAEERRVLRLDIPSELRPHLAPTPTPEPAPEAVQDVVEERSRRWHPAS